MNLTLLGNFGLGEDSTGLISSGLQPGCSHSLGSDSIWCAEPFNSILIPTKPNRQLREPTILIILNLSDQLQGEGGGSFLQCSLFAASQEQPLLCEIQERTSQRVWIRGGSGKTGGKSLGACPDGVPLACGLISQKTVCWVSVNSLCNTCLVQTRRGGGGGGADTGANVASYMKSFRL